MCSKSDIWSGYVIDCLFWPVILFTKTKTLLSGATFREIVKDPVADLNARQDERFRRLEEMAVSPPPCGDRVVYRHDHWGEFQSEIIFQSADIEHHFKGKRLPLFHVEENRALISFIRGREDDWTAVETIPDDINFENVALGLIEAGYGEVQCGECGKSYSVSELSRSKPPMHGGWNAETFSCPEEHVMFKHDYMHVHLSRD